MMRGCAGRQDRKLDEGELAVAMTWAEPLWDSVLLPQRFLDKARASLPGLRRPVEMTILDEEVFGALRLQRLRLRHDQQVPE